jgi:hypothetical protein
MSRQRRSTFSCRHIYLSSSLKVRILRHLLIDVITNNILGFALVADMVFVQQSAGRYAKTSLLIISFATNNRIVSCMLFSRFA